MGLGIWALIAYLGSMLVWNLALKRNISEAMGVGLIVTCLFMGKNALVMFWQSCAYAAQQEVVFAALAFVIMAYIMNKTGVIFRLVEILNSVLGRMTGGAAYISTIASALFGMVSGSGTGNAATVGSITVPWMIRSNWSPVMAAVINSGNAGLGVAIPPSSSMFLMLGIAGVAEKVSPGGLYIALFCGGMWTLVYRLFLVRYFVFRYKIQPMPLESLKSLRQSLGEGWTSLLIFLGIILPLAITIGPLAEYLSSIKSFGGKSVSSISIITWVPVLITLVTLIIGRKHLPTISQEWATDIIKSTGKNFALVGGSTFFAFAASYNLEKIGLEKDLVGVLSGASFSPLIMLLVIGVLIVFTAGPLSATATIVALGGTSFFALTYVGINPTVSAVVVLLFASLEGATPPNATPIFISCGIANVAMDRTFVPLLIYYVVPIMIVAIMIALDILPIFAG